MRSAAPSQRPVVGREAELARLRELLSRARSGHSGRVVLRGEPGIGKTALLAAVRGRAAKDMTVLEAAGVEGESDVPFAGLLNLLGPVLEHLEELPDHQRAALAGALTLGPPAAADPLTLGTALLAVLDAAAERRPLLVLADDLHWLDSASASTLIFAARRLREERIAVVVAIRDGERPQVDLSGFEELPIAGLGHPAAAVLLGRAGGHVPPATVVEQLVGATGGNPLALLALAATLTEDQLSGAEPIGEPVAVGRPLAEVFGRRAAGLSAGCRAALLLVAVASDERLEPVVAAAPALGADAAALGEAESAGVVELDAGRVRFSHPLMRAALYHGAAGTDRRRAHAALAAVEPSAVRRAWHLAEAAVGPHEGAAAALEAATCEARARGGQGAAAAALGRAAALTSAGPARARREVSAAEAWLLAGSAERALEAARAALEQDPDNAARAGAELLLSRLEVLRGSLDEAHRRGVAAAELIVAEDPERAVEMLLEAGLPGFMAGTIDLAVATSARAYEVASEAAPEALVSATVLHGAALTIAGQFDQGRPLLERWLELHVPERMLLSPPELIGATQSITWIEEYDACLAICDRVVERGRSLGAAGPLQLALGQRADVSYRLGNWTQTRADASESARLAESTGQIVQGSFPLVVLARLEAAMGLTEAATRHAAAVMEIAKASGMNSMAAYVAALRCLAALGGGDAARAAEHGREVRRLVDGFGMRDPSVVQWRADFVEALVRSGLHEEAGAEAEAFAQQAELTGRAWPLAAAQRCRGLLAADGEIDDHFRRALDHHAGGADPFERYRTQLAWGERLRRARRPRDAREPLRAALAGFERLGAEPWTRRTRAELRASGAAAPPAQRQLSRDLTDQELEVAMLVSRGATNREAAAALFMSPKTVEAHLGRTYRKLGVRSRTELAAIFGDAALRERSVAS